MSKKKPAYIDGKFVGDTLSISVKPHYQKEYEFLKSHHNRSGLICELIRQYLEGGELTLGFQKPVQNTQQPEKKEVEQKETKEEIKPKENASKAVKKEEDKNKVPVMAMPSFLSN